MESACLAFVDMHPYCPCLIAHVCSPGHTDLVKLLLEKKADPELKNRKGQSSIDAASSDEIRCLQAWHTPYTYALAQTDYEAHVQSAASLCTPRAS